MPKACSLLVKIAGVLLALSTSVAAQDYPTKPVRLIIPFPPGGSNDVVGRMIAIQLSERLGKQVVVDNRGGAGGIIGTEAAANSPHDGYTLLIIAIAHAVSPWLYKLQYDPIKSFVPVSILASGPNVLVVNPELPVHSVGELIKLAKQKPGELNYASAGIGSFQHLGGELFKLTAGVDMVHVPYRGGGPAMTDVLVGYTIIMFSSLVPPSRFVHNDISAVQHSQKTKKHSPTEGAEIVKMTSADSGALRATEIKRWNRVAKEGGNRAGGADPLPLAGGGKEAPPFLSARIEDLGEP